MNISLATARRACWRAGMTLILVVIRGFAGGMLIALARSHLTDTRELAILFVCGLIVVNITPIRLK